MDLGLKEMVALITGSSRGMLSWLLKKGYLRPEDYCYLDISVL
ncbi:hypothetical protein [Neobacillus jeddahensis]|nr:hypothetical protein [Neobacillus jeddahensis]